MDNKFYTFKRGSVVMVNFSPQVGSEIKGKHFAIVLTKKDRNTNELLTVIPLTSKYHKYHLDLGDSIKKSIYLKIIEHQQNISSDFKLIDDGKTVVVEINGIPKEMEMLSNVITRYQSLKEHTYAKPHQITTISKLRIVKPVNKLDPIRSLTVPHEVMDKIDKAILNLFTKFDID